MRSLLRGKRPYVKDTLAVNLNFLKKKYSIDLKKIPMTNRTFRNYAEGTSTPPIPALIKFMSMLKDPHNNLTVDEILFKDITPEVPEKNSMFKGVRSDHGKKRKQKGGNYKKQGVDNPRDKLHITEAEYQALLRPHSKEDLAYINRDDGQYGEAEPSVGREDELSMNELKEIDTACTKYLESVGSKDLFNPSDIGNNTPMHLKRKRKG